MRRLTYTNIIWLVYLCVFFKSTKRETPVFLRPSVLQGYKTKKIELSHVHRFLFAYASSHHLFSSRTCASSSGVKSLTMLKVFLISSGVLPFIIDATLAQVRSSKLFMSSIIYHFLQDQYRAFHFGPGFLQLCLALKDFLRLGLDFLILIFLSPKLTLTTFPFAFFT